ncbi:hypothetical protein SRHO_G00103070 [Serrasalmus rhombeus]
MDLEMTGAPILLSALPLGVWVKKNQSSFTLLQVSYLCEHVLREEFNRVLNIKLAVTSSFLCFWVMTLKPSVADHRL